MNWHDVYMGALLNPPVEFSKKLHAIVYINKNCSPSSQRHEVMRQLQFLLKASNSSLAVHSYGKCDANMDAKGLDFTSQADRARKKIQLFQRYKFCVVSGREMNNI